MSGNLGELTVRFTGDASSLSSTISKVQSELSGMNAMSQKGVKSIAEQTRQMGGYDKIVAKSAESLKQKRSILAETEKAYKQNTKQLNENIKGLNGQKSAIGSLMTSKKAEIQALESANAGLNKNSQAYKDNVKAIQWTQNEYKGLQKQHDEVSKSILSNESALNRESAAYNSAKSAVANASQQYKTLAQNQKAIVGMEKALNLQDVGESWQKAGQSIDAITKPIQLASVALAAGGVASAKFAIDFEDNFANVKKTVDGTEPQLEKVRQGIIDLTTTGIDGRNAIPQTTAQLTELAATGGQLGIATDEIVNFTETMAQMNTATNLNGAEGAAILAKFMNVTGTEQREVRNLGSAIVDLGNHSATTEADIASMALRLGRTGTVVGISAQDVLGYSTALSSLGIDAEAGGSAVSRTWTKLQNAVSQGGEDLDNFSKISGMSADEFKQAWAESPSSAFNSFVKGLSQSEDIISDLQNVGINDVREGDAMKALATGYDKMVSALQRANTAWEDGTALQNEFDAKAETTASQIQVTKNNLVEAARGIGETFLPTIKNVSGGIKDFAQDIANMDDDSKQGLINIGTGLIGMGAGAKVIAGTAKGVGNFVETLGKLGVAAPTLASMGPVALAAAGGILAVGAAAVVGVKAYQEYHDAQLDVVKATDEQIQATKKSLDTYTKIQGWKSEAQQLETTIKTSTDTEEVDRAKKKLEELKAQVEQEYNITLTANDGDLNKTLEKLGNRATSDLRGQRGDLQQQINESDFSQAVSNMKDYDNQLQTAQNSVDKYSSALAKSKDIMSDYRTEQNELKSAEKSMPRDEYIKKQNELAESYEKTLNAMYEAEGVSDKVKAHALTDPYGNANIDEGIGYLKSALSDAQTEVNNLSADFDKSSAEVEQYKEAVKGVADVTSALVPEQLANGEYSQALSGIKTALGDVKSYTQEMGFDKFASDITEQLTVAQQGFKNIAQVAKSGDNGISNFFSDFASNAAKAGAGADDISKSLASAGTALIENGADINNTVDKYINTSQKFNASAEDTAVGAALIKNGFRDIASAAATNGGLEVVTEQANELARSMGVLSDNQRIHITAEGDISTITEIDGKLQEINEKNVDIKLNTKTENYEVLDKAGNKISEIDGKTATVSVNANGNYDVLNQAGNKIAEIDGKTGQVRLEVSDGATPTVEQINSAVGELDGRAARVEVVAGGNYEIFDEVGNKIADIDGKTGTATVNVKKGDMSGVELLDKPFKNESISSTINFTLGTYPTSIPDVPGTANYNLGTYPTSVPDAPGVANYKGNFPSSAPTLHGTVVYKAEIQGAPRAKGDKNFPGGMAMINDEKGTSDPRELVEYGGRGYIFEGRDVVLPLPEHAKIYTAKQTKQIMSGAGIPRYASGKNNEDWENAKSDREHIRKTSYNIIPAWEELEWLDQMKQKFASDAEVIKEIEEEIVNYTKELWSQNLESMEFALDMGWTSQEEYYNNLAVYRDENFAPDTQEWKDATLKLHKYSQQLIDDANNASKAYIDLHARLNDWGEMGTSMGAVWQTVNQRNVQAAKDGLITWEDYFDTRLDYTEQFLDGYLDYSDDWVENEQEYNNMSADDTIAAVNRQRKEVEEYFAGLGELTDEEYAYKVKIEAELDRKSYDAVRDKLSEWEDDADWTEKQAGVYGWEEIGENKLDFYQRKIDKYTQWSQDESLDPTKQQYARRQADEMKMKLYEATEDRYDEMLDMAKDRMDEVKDLLDDKLSALEESWEVEDRAEDKAETLSDIEKYKNAVTIEGKQKYQEALDKLKEIERDEQRYQIEQENNAIIKQMEAEYKALEDEKANILQQTKEANLKVASVVEPLEQSINANMDNMASRIEAAIKEIKPSITVTQNITSNINDGTDGILYHNKVLSKTVTAVGGQK
ncbi:phage tail tape measure protein [Monoglobus pectinilyticus]|uniref:phage tail tape measure protein n=1 Tax=Monoglobus pectinilyticus TaxID=1981510 RepID=UPI00399BB935